MAKKKPQRQTKRQGPVNITEKLITEVFDDKIQIANNLFVGKTVEAQDLAGPVLKRRIAATYAYMDQVNLRYAHRYP